MTERETLIAGGLLRPFPGGWLDRPTLRIDKAGQEAAAQRIREPLDPHLAQKELESGLLWKDRPAR